MAPLHPNREILSPALRAPLPLTANPRPVLLAAFREALRQGGATPELIEPAATIGGGLIHASQELVLGLNRLVGEPGPAPTEAVRVALWACRDFLGARNSAYVLEQAAETIPGSPPESSKDFERGKDLMDPMERRFEELGLPVRMDPVRFAVLQVHLDEIYDLAARQLERFYGALADPEPSGRFAHFARSLAVAVTREIIPDHVLAESQGPGRERTGLLDLLPELEREFL